MLVLQIPDLSPCKIKPYCTLPSKFDCKTSVTLLTHEIHQHFALRARYGCLSWVIWKSVTVKYRERTVLALSVNERDPSYVYILCAFECLVMIKYRMVPSWRFQMDIFSASLSLCVGNPLVTCGFPSQMDDNADLWCFSVISMKNCWTNTRLTGSSRRHDCHLTWSYCRHTLFSITSLVAGQLKTLVPEAGISGRGK